MDPRSQGKLSQDKGSVFQLPVCYVRPEFQSVCTNEATKDLKIPSGGSFIHSLTVEFNLVISYNQRGSILVEWTWSSTHWRFHTGDRFSVKFFLRDSMFFSTRTNIFTQGALLTKAVWDESSKLLGILRFSYEGLLSPSRILPDVLWNLKIGL